jgi:hypothetical protein
MSTLQVNTIQTNTPAGVLAVRDSNNALTSIQPSALRGTAVLTAPVFQDSAGTQIGTLARAWVNFSAGTGSPVIRSSFNVSSITDGGVGNFTINFTTAMPDADYCVLSVANEGSSVTTRESQFGTQTTSNVQMLTRSFASGVNAGALTDFFQNHLAVFR